MEINEMNYELYAIDYAEGTLSGEEAVAMEAFMSQHPELAEEIIGIAAITVPLDPVAFPDKANLKRKGRAIAILPIALAVSSAACLVLALGLIWMVDRQQYYGELLSSSNSSIEIDAFKGEVIEIIVEREIQLLPVAEPAYEGAVSGYSDNQQVAHNPPDSEMDASFDIQLSVIPAIESVTDQVDESEGQQDLFPDDIVSLQSDYEFVVPVTLEMHHLSTKGEERLRSKLEKQEDKMARRQQIKDGAFSVFQEKLMPAGLAGLINN
ncbi:MAG: hypothetical protein GY751_18255 [Bacteroidetes bacterium]|nr:hypothetical protein [Bacteroidota bacterium]